MARIAIVCGLIFLCGCQREPSSIRPVFTDFYQAAGQSHFASAPPDSDARVSVTLSARSMPLRVFLQEVYDQTGITVIVEEGLGEREVTLDASELPIDGLLLKVARRFGVALAGSGRLYYIGQRKPQDSGWFLRRMRRLAPDDAKAALEMLLSDSGSVSVFPDGLVLVSDSIETLQRVWEASERIESAPSDCWVFQLFIVSISERDSVSFGLDLTHLAEATATVASGGSSDSSLATLRAVLVAAAESQTSSVVAQPLLLVSDGHRASITSGDSIPVPRRTVSDAGTVSVAGYDYIQTGLQVDLSARQLPDGSCSYELAFALDSLAGFVGEAPITSRLTADTKGSLRSGAVQLLASLDWDGASAGSSGPGFPSQWSRSHDSSTLQIWGRAYCVGGPIKEKGP